MKPIHCPEESEVRIYYNFCDKSRVGRYYQNHLKSQTHLNNRRKKNSTIRLIFLWHFKFLSLFK